MTPIDQKDFYDYLAAALHQNGMTDFARDEALAASLYALTCRMLEVNEHMNLTTIKQPHDVIMRHYVDSLTVAAHIPTGATVLDIGCGAGFPCLPLALARPDLHITAIDSTEKKVRYVGETASLLGISPDTLTAVAMRAEEGGSVGGQLREIFNIAVSRAVAHLSILGELALPCLKLGGTLIALKGAKAAEEMEDAKGLRVLGASPARLIPTPLTPPDSSESDSHALVMLDKCEKTPKIYPRKYAQIVKKPL
ncbi:MAG: 16S rRNA (guanine(527)-N(7))-methyltransferase RsmG [Clostridia bacterium]|nr:16S rRNA (guanine(527)-N(7))-methyltransferase RsmG [Clostridia bacterium]